jgi:hypothetical protein
MMKKPTPIPTNAMHYATPTPTMNPSRCPLSRENPLNKANFFFDPSKRNEHVPKKNADGSRCGVNRAVLTQTPS